MIRRNVELEAKLIDDLLDLTKIGRGKLQLHVETVDAHQALRNALHVTSADEIAMKRLNIHVNLDAEQHHVRGDPARLQQVFWNLLKNAVKFTPAAGNITVSTWNDDRTRLHISVADTGIGIDPDVLPRIFDAFEQGEIAKARAFGGLGLGLAISKGLIDAHGGTIRAQSDGRNRGSTFTVVLDTVPAPVTRAPQEVAPSPARKAVAAASGPSISVLLVEDHQDTARALYRLLQRCGYSVSSADSVNSALRLAAQSDFDVLVSDLGLPDGSGLDLVRELRVRGPVKAIALTGYGMEEDIARSLEAGFNEHLTKPVNFQKLRATIERITSVTPAGVD
jgi:CheY-like chemotaxis protein/anti-sigma regulatory factor (Ser/Thr protein kinase)